MIENSRKRGRQPAKKEDVKVSDDSLNILNRLKNRIPITESKRIMSIPNEDKSMRYILPTDEDNDIQSYYEAGYSFVAKDGKILDTDQRIQDPAVRGSLAWQHVGGGDIGFLMCIPVELWDEDQARKQRKLDLKVKGLENPRIPGTPDNQVFSSIQIDS